MSFSAADIRREMGHITGLADEMDGRAIEVGWSTPHGAELNEMAATLRGIADDLDDLANQVTEDELCQET